MADQFDFRGVPRQSTAYQDAINTYVHGKSLEEALQVGTANKQSEIDAMLARAQMSEDAAASRNAATNEAHLAINQANNDTQRLTHLVPKETVAAYNRSEGTNFPEADVPATVFGSWVQEQKQAKTMEVRERIRANTDATNLERTLSSNERIANTQAGVAQRAQDIEQRRIITANNMDLHRQELERLAQQRHDSDVVQGNLASQLKGALNSTPNKQGLNTVFDPGQALIDNPQEALALASQIGAAGGLPKGVPVAPIKPYPAPGVGNAWMQTDAYTADKAKYDANVTQWKTAVAPPSTGGGLNKGVPSELGPTTSTPQPTTMGGFPSTVGAQPQTTAPGPTAGSPPSSLPTGYVKGTYKGRPAMVNQSTGHVQYLDSPGAM